MHVPPSGVTIVPGSTTQTVVSGLTADTNYRLVVLAYNGQGCSASVQVSATPRDRPSIVTAITAEGPVAVAEGRWDFRLLGITLSGADSVDSVQYRLIGAGVDSAESTPAAVPTLLTAGTSHYGRAVQVEVRGCRQYEQLLCGPWSSAFDLGVAVLIDVQPTVSVTGSVPDPRRVAISFTPVGLNDYDVVDHLCVGGDPIDYPDASNCDITATASDDPRLVVTVTENAITYTREYRP